MSPIYIKDINYRFLQIWKIELSRHLFRLPYILTWEEKVFVYQVEDIRSSSNDVPYAVKSNASNTFWNSQFFTYGVFNAFSNYVFIVYGSKVDSKIAKKKNISKLNSCPNLDINKKAFNFL